MTTMMMMVMMIIVTAIDIVGQVNRRSPQEWTRMFTCQREFIFSMTNKSQSCVLCEAQSPSSSLTILTCRLILERPCLGHILFLALVVGCRRGTKSESTYSLLRYKMPKPTHYQPPLEITTQRWTSSPPPIQSPTSNLLPCPHPRPLQQA